ncbi:hypothetical protein MMC25_003955 [Agyrium rufum]|nr:hypothetical protein [Agyrium rufum]
MLDCFEILTTSGVVLWSRSNVPVAASLIDSFIRDVFIEEKVFAGSAIAVEDDGLASQNPSYKKEQYTLRWTAVKDLGLIFVAVYQSLIHLTWVDKLLDNLRTIFVDLYRDQLKNPYSSVVECDGFGVYFDQQTRELEGATEKHVGGRSNHGPREEDFTPPSSSDAGDEAMPPPPIPGYVKPRAPASDSTATSTDVTPIPTPDTSRPSTPLSSQILSAKGGPKGSLSRRAKKAAAAASSTGVSSGEEDLKNKRPKASKAPSKVMRTWDGGLPAENDGTNLDFSSDVPGTEDEDTVRSDRAIQPELENIDSSQFGTRTGGNYILKDLDDEVHSILADASSKKSDASSAQSSGLVGSSIGAISGLFRNFVGGKVLTKQDLEKPMKGMEDHLLNKNVAREAAVRLCEGVEKELVGVKTGSFESVETAIRSAMESSLRKILTPTSSLDLLRSINAVTNPSTMNPLAPKPRPYVISIVGVNGVGKSTNLSKLAYFLLQNNKKILIAACDTFRSGAVEQLKVHARNLSELSARESRGSVELFEKGYGSDVNAIARNAVSYAAQMGMDVVLIDTAGRRHNDTRLMAPLERFAQSAKPDKILMVGEALVGSDSVMQARNFNAAFGRERGLDGFIISKCDTVGDMVGTLVSMVHATGIPVVLLGVGQHYGDLRTLNVSWAVERLMR